MEAGLALNKLVGEVVFGWKGIGHYGPPADGAPWRHAESVCYDTYEEAYQAYKVYYDNQPNTEHYGRATPDEMNFDQCYWSDGWGPLRMPDFSADEKSWRNKEDDHGAVYDAWLIVNRMIQRGFVPIMRWNPRSDVWLVYFAPIDMGHPGHHGFYEHGSISMAICRSALIACGFIVEGSSCQS